MFNTNYKRFSFLNYLSCGSCIFSMMDFTAYYFSRDTSYIILAFIEFVVFIILFLYAAKYFKKTYQFKKNANKVIVKSNIIKG